MPPDLRFDLHWDPTKNIQQNHSLHEAMSGTHPLQIAADQSASLLWESDVIGSVRRYSARWVQFTGQTAATLTDQAWIELLHPDDRSAYLELQDQARAKPRIYQTEYRLRRADGEHRWFFEQVLPQFGSKGDLQGYAGVATDIHDSRVAERIQRSVLKAGMALAADLDFDATLRNLTRLLVPEHADWCSIDLVQDDGSVREFGFHHRDPEKVLWVENDRRRTPLDTPVSQTQLPPLTTGTSDFYPEVTPSVIERLAKNESHRNLLMDMGVASALVVPMHGRGRIIGNLNLMMAESERRYTLDDLRLVEAIAARAALALDNALLYRSARAANRSKDEFLAMISHELRTPLNVVLGWTDLMLSEFDPEPEMREGLRAVLRNAQTQSKLIDDLLDLSRIICGRLTVTPEPTHLSAVLTAALESARPSASAKNLRLITHLEPQFQAVHADPARLQQVFGNLLSNAIKFTPPSGQITVSLRNEGGGYAIAFQDTGEGISPDFLPYVFDRFRQQDATLSGRHSGLGLGLAIVRQLVEAQGGVVTAASKGPGLGSTFTVWLRAESHGIQPTASLNEEA